MTEEKQEAVCGTCYDENDGEPRPDCPICGDEGVFSEAVAQFEHLTELAQNAVALHEIYLGLRAGGFQEEQALYIVAQVLLGQPNEDDES